MITDLRDPDSMQYQTVSAKTLGDYNVAINEVRALRRHNLYATGRC